MDNFSPKLRLRYVPKNQIRQQITQSQSTSTTGGPKSATSNSVTVTSNKTPDASNTTPLLSTATSPPSSGVSPASTAPETTSLESSTFTPPAITSVGSAIKISPNSTSTTSTPSLETKISSSDQGVGPGAAAGIGVGTFFAGVLLTLAGIWLFTMLRKKKGRSQASGSRHRHFRDSSREYGAPTDNGTELKGMSSTVHPVETTRDIKVDKILLEPVSSSDLRTDMMSIGSQIGQHVDNNYHLKPVDILPTGFAEALTKSNYSSFTGVSIEQLSRLLRDAQTRRAAIRHVISFFIFSRIALTSDLESSLLPSYLTAFLRQMPAAERTTGSREAFDQALTKWRLLSAYLLQTVRSNRDPLLPKDDDIQPAIARNLSAIRQVLAPFVIPGAERRQVENLQGLMSEAARFGLLLFQQPVSWVVDWEIPETQSSNAKMGGSRAKGSAIVLFPGLIQTANEEGKRYTEVRVVLASEVMYL